MPTMPPGTRTPFDDDNDGTIDRIAFDFDGDGNIDRMVHLNDDGRWERVERDDDDDGTIDRTVYRNTDGTNTLDRIDFDDDGDGITDRSEDYTHNADDNRIQTGFDDDGDGTIDRNETYTYDENGNRTRTGFDTDADGTTDRITRFAFDDDGNRTRAEFDTDADGTADRITHYTFDDDGTSRVTRRDSDLDDDGNIDRTVHLNDDGRWERVERDDDDDGTIDRTVHRNTDGTNTLNRIDFDDDGDGTTDRSEFYTHNADNDRIRTGFDDDGDGTIDRIEYDDDADGTTDRIEFYTYNPDGRVSRTDFDDDADGTIDRSARALSSLDGTNGFILNGIDASDYSGWSVSSAGDVNGDGYDDLIIGAWGADPNGDSEAGETYIVYGGASAPGSDGVLDLGALDGTNGFTLTGIDASDTSGRSVSSAGDVNGDGYDDLIIGARRADPNGDSDAGETYIVYGGARAPGTEGVLDLSMLNGTNGFILTGIDAGDRSGVSVSSTGDVNGDGYDDLVIGAYWANPNGDFQAGETYIVYGGARAPGEDGVLDLGALNGTNGFILTGIDALDQSGTSVSSAGDVNGDGYDDLIIGARFASPNGDSYAGETYIVYGGARAPGTDGVLDLSMLDGSNGFTLTGIDASDYSGSSVSSAGDVNGDGYDDLIIGASSADPNGDNEAGETYVVYGGANAPGSGGRFNLSDLDGSNGFILNGIDEADESGISVSSAGDVNGDGYDDLIIGAFRADPNEGGSGETYIVYGGAGAPGTGGVLDLSSLNGTNGFILNGIDGGDGSGRSVSSAGDVNGDGYDDLVIGAWAADPNGNFSGEAYLLYGGATGTESLVSIMAPGTAAADNFTGNAGADSFTGIATDDVVRGGAGDDTISVTALDFAAIDGGTGVDTLVLDGANLALDLTGPGNAGVDSVEVFDLSGTGANTLVLDAQAVFDVTEEREGSVASLDVLGDADDRVDLGGSNFALTGTVTEDGTIYHVYRDGNAQVRVEDGVTVTLAAAGSQSARSLTADPDLMPDMSHADAREGIDGTGLYSLGHSLGMDVDFMDGLGESEFEWTGVVVTGLAPPDMQAPGPLSSDPAINPFDALMANDLSYDFLL